MPAISASSPNLAATLNESSSRSGIGSRSGKLRSVLVVTEMALALVLVIGAALLIRTFLKLESVDPGFDTHNVLTPRAMRPRPVAQDISTFPGAISTLSRFLFCAGALSPSGTTHPPLAWSSSTRRWLRSSGRLAILLMTVC